MFSLLHITTPHDFCLIPQVPSSPTCSSPERGGEQDSLYGDGYSKIYNRWIHSHTICYFPFLQPKDFVDPQT